MNEELCKWLNEHKPSKDEITKFKLSVQELENAFSETSKKLKPNYTDLKRYYDL
jgi:hypothetical protein